MTRKVLRFGKPLPLVKAILDRIKEHKKRSVKMVFWRTISDICLIIYFITDHPLYFNKIGITTLSKETISQIDYYNNFFWLMNAVLDMICDLVDLYYL